MTWRANEGLDRGKQKKKQVVLTKKLRPRMSKKKTLGINVKEPLTLEFER